MGREKYVSNGTKTQIILHDTDMLEVAKEAAVGHKLEDDHDCVLVDDLAQQSDDIGVLELGDKLRLSK